MGVRRHLMAAAGAAAVLALAGLAAPAAAQFAGKSVKLGVLNDQSGVYIDLGGPGSVEAAKMAVEDFGGKVGGLPVEVISGDHQNKPDVGSNIARKWFDEDGVSAVLDVPNSAVALAVNQVAKEKKKIFIASGPATSELTGKQCTPYTVHWTYDNWALANGTAKAIVQSGGDSWFFLTADYAFGHDLEDQVSNVVKAAGGKVLGHVLAPLATTDFSSFLLQAQASKAKVIGLANAGADTTNSIKQASEFGISEGGQQLAGLLVFITDVHALGLQAAKGLIFTEAFYWDLNDGTRAWSKKFAARMKGAMPTMVQAGVYAGTLHMLKAMQAAGTDDAAKVVAKMKEMPTDDPLFGKGSVRADGRALHDMYLFGTKAQSESKGPWDLYKLVRTIPAAEAFRPLAAGGCPLVKG